MMSLLDSKYYAEACRKYGARWDSELEEAARERGRDEGRREVINTVLSSIFAGLNKRLPDSTISDNTLKKLNQINDPQMLKKILDFSFDAPMMKDFEDFVANLQ